MLVFVPGRTFQSKTTFVAMPGAFHRVEHLKCGSLRKASGLLTNIRQGWKGLQVRNALAYYKLL
jgi:hypothetical protein